MLYREQETLEPHAGATHPQPLEQLWKRENARQRQNGVPLSPQPDQRVGAATVSVVIRTFNEAKMLGLVFDALATQSGPTPDVILVDSGSTDGTTEIAAERGATIIRTAPEQFSYGRALNIGFEASQTEFVVALSGHAVPAHPQWLETLLGCFQEASVAAVASRLVPYPKTALHNYWLSLPFFLYRTHRRNALWLFWNTATAYRRQAWTRLPFDEAMPGCEDREWAIRAIAHGCDVAYEPAARVWHSHDESYARFLRRVAFTTMMSHRYKNRLPRR